MLVQESCWNHNNAFRVMRSLNENNNSFTLWFYLDFSYEVVLITFTRSISYLRNSPFSGAIMLLCISDSLDNQKKREISSAFAWKFERQWKEENGEVGEIIVACNRRKEWTTLPSCVRAKKLLLISDACAAAGFTFFAPAPDSRGSTDERSPYAPPPLSLFHCFCLSLHLDLEYSYQLSKRRADDHLSTASTTNWLLQFHPFRTTATISSYPRLDLFEE